MLATELVTWFVLETTPAPVTPAPVVGGGERGAGADAARGAVGIAAAVVVAAATVELPGSMLLFAAATTTGFAFSLTGVGAPGLTSPVLFIFSIFSS